MRQGDQQAMSELYDQTSSVVYGLALRVVRNREDAEEVVLDTYSRVWRTIHSFDRGRGSFMTWLIMMTRSVAIDRLRSGAVRAARTEALDDQAASAAFSTNEPGPESAAFFGQQRQRIQSALEQLPAEQREVIELAFFRGLSHSELAEKTGLPLGTVKTRVRLGLARLRDSLGDLT
jgi:RNA polymerase sigma-70 factor (ECF subfamily)